MKQKMILKCALMGAVGCGLASAAVAIQNTQPMKGHPDWGYTIYGLPGDGSTKQTAYVFTNQNATLSWKAPSDVSSVRLLVVGGGGAGGGKYDTSNKDAGYGGGGGGGFTAVDLIGVTSGDTYDIVVGKGGLSDKSHSENGEQSSFVGTGVEARADGGGYGGGFYPNVSGAGGDGANGGGGGFFWKGSGSTYTQQNGGSATGFGAGYAGGKNGGQSYRSGGGGGGAGGAGATPASKNGGAGGVGKMSDITGSEVYYAGGGGGGGNDNYGGAGGIGGGGNGGKGNGSDGETGTKHGVAGVDGLGGGGGGSGSNAQISGGKGGSGVVIVRCNESVEDPNPHPEGHDPMDVSWTGQGADANWSTRENWSTGRDDQLYYFDTAVFSASCTAAVTMDKTTDAEYPAAALLSIGANANVTLGGAKVNYFAGNKAMALMGDGATLTVTGAGNKLYVKNTGVYTIGDNTTVKVTGGADFEVTYDSLDLSGAQGVKFVAEGADSDLHILLIEPSENADVTFEARNGGRARPEGYVTGANSKVTVVTDGGNFDANYIDIGGALVRLVAGTGTQLKIGALDVAAGSMINVTNASMSIYSNGNPTKLGVDGAVTLELVGANPQFKKDYHNGLCTFGDKLTVKLRPEASWTAGPRIFCTREPDPAWTVSSGVHYEIDCSALAPKQELTFRLYELKGTKGDSVAAPAAGNVTLVGKNADRFDVSFALSADGKSLDCTLKPKKFGFIFSIR